MAHEKKILHLSGFDVELTRKKMKSLRMRVDAKLVRVSVPKRTAFHDIEAFVEQNRQWISAKQQEAKSLEKDNHRSLNDGEEVTIWGHKKAIASEHGITQSSRDRVQVLERGDVLVFRSLGLNAPSFEAKQKALDTFYRQQLKDTIPGLLDKWQEVVGVKANEWGVKKMKTRWGSCNIDHQRIWLNTELARWPIACLEYVVVHELTHILETNHTSRFWNLVEKSMPTWKTSHEMLNTVG